jgi:hypothetical protein
MAGSGRSFGSLNTQFTGFAGFADRDSLSVGGILSDTGERGAAAVNDTVPTGDTPAQGTPAQGVSEQSVSEQSAAASRVSAAQGTRVKQPKTFQGVDKLNKTNTAYAWKEFGGDAAAVFIEGGGAYIVREIARESKKSGGYFKLVEKLERVAGGAGTISWTLTTGAVARRKPTQHKFDVSWKPAILRKIREVVSDGAAVTASSKALARELDVPYSTLRANIWVADRWARGASTTFLPHREMIRPIFDLLCELGKKQNALSAIKAYPGGASKLPEALSSIIAGASY